MRFSGKETIQKQGNKYKKKTTLQHMTWALCVQNKYLKKSNKRFILLIAMVTAAIIHYLHRHQIDLD
jgi:hypothetical protein